MADNIDPYPAEDPAASSDEETIKGDQEQDHIAEILEEERQEDATIAPSDSHGAIATRYRQLLREQDDASDSGSAEGLPRRAGSPIDSLLSVPDDSPSVQVSLINKILKARQLTGCAGLGHQLAWQ